jgi:hypothetical protein
VRISGEFETAVFLSDDHRKESVTLKEIPHLWRHVAPTVRDIEVVDHPAEFFARPV